MVCATFLGFGGWETASNVATGTMMAIGQREGRRRRVLRDDAPSGKQDSRSKSNSRSKSKLYADAALVELQPRVTDLIPDRLVGLACVLFVGVGSAVAVQAIYHYRVSRLAHVDYQVVSGLDLYGPGTIVSWIASVYLLMAGAAALLVYNTRRHKVDDYFGRYSLWIWLAVFCTIASLDATTGLHRVVQYGLTKVTGTALWGDGSIWWIAIYGLVALVLGGRAMADMWPCRGGLTFLAAAVGCYATAAVIYLGLYRPNLGHHNLTLHSSSLIMGHFLVLYSFLLYARSIHRMAQGLAGKKSKKANQRVGWFARQQNRLASAREERAAARTARQTAKEEKINAREAARAEAREQARASKQQKADEKAQAKQAAAQAKQSRREAAKAERAKASSADQPSADAKPKSRTTPIDVKKMRAESSANRGASQQNPAQSGGQNVEMTGEEIEMELLTNPNLSKAERRKLRKQLKDRRSQQRQAA